ncbi:MAG: ArsA family ATPase [Acidimicrobiales bacterium]
MSNATGGSSSPPVGPLDRRLLLVTGKGGVGRSTVAGALALALASGGHRTLACEADARGDLAELLEHSESSFTPSPVVEDLMLMAMDTEEALGEYLRLQLRVPVVTRLGRLARMLEFVATAAPGVREILVMGKIAWEVREGPYDRVVVDAAATGHIVGQLAAPATVRSLVGAGPLTQQASWVAELLADPAVTGLVIVTAPEEIPINEALDLVARVRADTDTEVAAVVVNRVWPEPFTRTEQQVFDQIRTAPLSGRLAGLAGGDVDPLMMTTELAVRLRRHGATHIDRLRNALDPAIPMVLVPEMFGAAAGRDTLAAVGRALVEELDVG